MGSSVSTIEDDIPPRTLDNAEQNPFSTIPKDSRDLIIHQPYQELEFSKAASNAPVFKASIPKLPITRAMISFPYTYISCPCTDAGNAPPDDDEEEQEWTFDPSSPRANYSLYPLEHLMYLNTFEPDGNPINGPWILACGYCNWTTLDIGIKFDKPSNIANQLSKFTNGGHIRHNKPKNPAEGPESPPENDPDAKFHALKYFLSSQLSSSSSLSNPLLTPSGDYNYSSPSSLARIMSLYTGLGSYGKKSVAKTNPMRESASPPEGLHVIDPASDASAIRKLRTEGWAGTASVAQRAEQRHPPRFIDDIRPVAQILRTKRSKRCRTCRHILVKPEPKITSTRYRIRLLALNYIPTISLKQLQSPGQPANDLNALPALRASQFLLKLTNPMFDVAVKITLATPSHTPGRYGHKVTILCPQFDIGPNTDAWDEALGGVDSATARRAHKAATGSYMYPDPPAMQADKVAEAGKVWEKTRNSTTVVLEVVCAEIGEDAEVVEDEDVLEIPVFVRMEWEGEVAEGEGEKGGKEKRELAYWAVVGVGRVARLKAMSLGDAGSG